MKRRNFLRDCLMGIAVSLVPKSLQPSMPVLVGEGDAYMGIIHLMEKNGSTVIYNPDVFFVTVLDENGDRIDCWDMFKK